MSAGGGHMSADEAKRASADHMERVIGERMIGERQELEREPRQLLPENLRRKADELAIDVAERLEDVETDEQIVDRPGNVEPIFGSPMWLPGTLSNGLAGTALMYSLLAQSDSRYLQLAHQHLQAALKAATWNTQGGLIGGPAGILAAAQGASGVGKNYPGLREKLAFRLAATQTETVRTYAEELKDGVHWLAYDIMHGVTGVLRVLMDEPSKEACGAVETTSDYLCSHILKQHESGLPGWWVPSELEPVAEDSQTYPHGDLNLGLAHGVTGVVATLTTVAEREGLTPEIEDALRRAVDWMVMWRQEVDGIPYWPARVPAELNGSAQDAPPLFTRAAWCYGTPGVALTLMRAGRLLSDSDLIDTAVDALVGHLRAPERAWRLDGPTFCHGYAGTLHVLHRAWLIRDDERLRQLALTMASKLVDDMAEPDAPFIFRHWMPDSPEGWQKADSYKKVDSVGLLEGASGVAAVLYSLSLDDPSDLPAWDRVFALS